MFSCIESKFVPPPPPKKNLPEILCTPLHPISERVAVNKNSIEETFCLMLILHRGSTNKDGLEVKEKARGKRKS